MATNNAINNIQPYKLLSCKPIVQQVVPADEYHKVVCANTLYDPFNTWDTDTFTAPSDGIYTVVFNVISYIAAGGSKVSFYFYCNSSNRGLINISAGFYPGYPSGLIQTPTFALFMGTIQLYKDEEFYINAGSIDYVSYIDPTLAGSHDTELIITQDCLI